ncbi:MAG: hypothetical protein M1607_04195 [Patescibacteria group bacterium]|nr:hypothetical protein [Patescibacteria group bacterium]
MDFLQIALVILIIVVTILLTLMAIQAYFILKDMKHSLSILERFLNEVGRGDLSSSEQEAEQKRLLENAVKTAQQELKNNQPKHRFFRRG